MSRKQILSILLFIFCSTNVMAQADFYYYNGNKIPITLNEDKVCISIPKECDNISQRIQENVNILHTIADGTFDIIVISKSDYESLRAQDSWQEDLKSVIITPCYFLNDNAEAVVTPYLNVELKKEQDIDLLNTFAQDYKLNNKGHSKYLPLWYVLSVTPESEKNPLEYANLLYETGYFVASVPDFANLVSQTTYGQLFTPLGLGMEKCERMGPNPCPQMHVEGDTVYVCTNQGLYSKDLSNDTSSWQLVGFEDIPLLDYARSGQDILALRYNVNGSFLLLSHDGGRTFEDITPDMFIEPLYPIIDASYNYRGNIMNNLAQHPTDPNIILVSSLTLGLFQSTDFGQTWSRLSTVSTTGFAGYHPLNPDIIYQSGQTSAWIPYINVSYNCGQTWNVINPYDNGDNCINRIAFHPETQDKWIVGGNGIVFKSTDNGQSWKMQKDSLFVGWKFTAYDNKDSDILYMAGRGNDIKVMCSKDEGETWSIPLTLPKRKTSETEIEYLNDFRQYGDKLLIYTESDVYVVLKDQLLAESTFPVNTVTGIEQQIAVRETGISYYDLTGRKMERPNGFTIVVTNYSDGSVKVKKVLY